MEVRASRFDDLLVKFRPAFTAPSFANFQALATAWLLCAGRHTISRAIQFARAVGDTGHHSTFYRFFSRARWTADQLGKIVFLLVLSLLPGVDVHVLVDDTLCRKGGPQLWGAGMHHDALKSNYGRGSRRVVSLAFGHNWVIVSVWVPLPWAPDRGLAVPVVVRLYRSKKHCAPKEEYRKRTQLALEALLLIDGWMPEERRLLVVGDGEYSCRTVVRGLPGRVVYVGRMGMDAALFAEPGEYSGKGRPRKKGDRLPNPAQLAADSSRPWKRLTVAIYGRQVEIDVKTQRCLWYRVGATRLMRMIVTRDPKGRIECRAFFSTDPRMSPEEIIRTFAMRWEEEVLHRNLKQFLGLEDPQNGWWRRAPGQRRDNRRPGAEPHARRGEKAVRRTVPSS